MFNKISIRTLAAVFVVLLAIVLIGIFSGNQKKSRSFKSDLAVFDTAQVSQIIVYPKSGGELITFKKRGNNWQVSEAGETCNADNDQVRNMLITVSELKAKRLAGKGKEYWDKYEVTDSLGTRVKLSGGKKALADVYVGKFSYTQPPQSANPYQRQQGTMTSFVRLNNDKDVYAVDGYLAIMFNRKIKDYRDSKVLKVPKNSIEQITINQPDGVITIVKNDSVWMVDGLMADSTAMEDYLSELSFVRSTDFLPEAMKPMGSATHQLRLEGGNGILLGEVDAFFVDSTNIAIAGSINEGTWFDGTKAELFTRLFKPKASLLEAE